MKYLNAQWSMNMKYLNTQWSMNTLWKVQMIWYETAMILVVKFMEISWENFTQKSSWQPAQVECAMSESMSAAEAESAGGARGWQPARHSWILFLFHQFYWHRATSVEFSERARLSAAPAGCQVDKAGASQLDPKLKTSTPLLGSQPIYNLQSSTTAPSNTRELWFTVNIWLILWGHLWMAWGIR